MMHIFQNTSRRYLLGCALFAILFMICSQSASATPQRDSQALPLSPSYWAGYQALDPQSTYRGADLGFQVPSLASPQQGKTSVAMWAGVGGYAPLGTPSEVVQTGVIFSIDSSGHQTSSAFWELIGQFNYPQDGTVHVIDMPPMSPGDLILIRVRSNANGDGMDRFDVVNFTRGANPGEIASATYQQDPNDPNHSALSDGGAIECGLELQGDSIANFGKITMHLCSAEINGQTKVTPIGNLSPNYQVSMVNNGTPVVNTSALTNGTDFDLTCVNNCQG